MVNHPNRSRRSATLPGHRQEESGSVVAGMLDLRRDDGGWYDPDMDFPGLPNTYVAAREYQITPTLRGIEIVGVGGGVFLPADGECERIGLTIERLV
jgi:hypothetical protein